MMISHYRNNTSENISYQYDKQKDGSDCENGEDVGDDGWWTLLRFTKQMLQQINHYTPFIGVCLSRIS